MGKEITGTGAFWHVFNEGVNKSEIFYDPLDSWRFLKALESFNTTARVKFFELFSDEHGHASRTPQEKTERKRTREKQLVQVVAFSLNPDHYHLLLKELVPGGIPLFMKKVAGGYTTYFNKHHERTGPLFSGRYKSVAITSDAQLQYLSAFINLNHHIHDISAEDSHVIRSSITTYADPDKGYDFVDTSELLFSFEGTREEYIQYSHETVDFIRNQKQQDKDFLRKELLD